MEAIQAVALMSSGAAYNALNAAVVNPMDEHYCGLAAIGFVFKDYPEKKHFCLENSVYYLIRLYTGQPYWITATVVDTCRYVVYDVKCFENIETYIDIFGNLKKNSRF